MTRLRLPSVLLLSLVLLSLLPAMSNATPTTPSRPAAPQPDIVVDGLIDTSYGPPAASDSNTDGNGNDVMDLLELYIAEDASSYYFAFTIDGDIGTTNWGKYAIYIDTTGDANGAPSDAWTRSVVVEDPHKPEFCIYSWVDNPPYGTDHTQFWAWDGSAWSQDGSADEAALSAGPTSVIEWRVAKSRIGDPAQIWAEVWSTGGGSNDNAQDTVNDPPEDWNAWDWGSQAHLLGSVRFPGVKLGINYPPDGHYFALPYVDVSGVISPTSGVTITVNLNDSSLFNPVVDANGAFTQPVVLESGANTITVTAGSASDDTVVVRHVSFGAAHDDNVFWDGLYHDSRNPNYRTPVGAVTPGTPVTLRLRAYANDLTDVSLRVWDDRNDSQMLYPMGIIASDPAYDYWGITLTPSEPTVFWYRFIVTDGSDTDYYEDDNRDASDIYRGYNEGGPGKAYENSPDYSYQITVYDASFQTPDWVKEAVFYQIFADRFRDGDPSNNVISGTHFVYGDPNGGIEYATWNSEVLDPRDPSNPFYNRWNQDFYGGDLDGITAQLDYLQGMGVTALYLNPIFYSPSTHKYDTTDFGQVDPHFGGSTALETLLAEADARGMHVILDGVFNHTSSDSYYFDKYSRYPTEGAYESQASPYYDWYTFYEWPDNYKSWWGYDSLPVLNSQHPAVRAYIYGDSDAIARRWIISGTVGWRLDVGGDIDSGLTHDPTNDYWENFRLAVKGSNPDAVIFGEEWGDATSWILGHEWDGVMNYRFRSALLSFMRDMHYEDNDNNSGSSGGVLDPITPSQLDAWLHSIQEDYPPEAWQAMMNLMGSHDTNRMRFVLSKNQKGVDNDHIPYNPATDLSPEEVDVYQKLLALLQFTLPGAPTVYSGDEVGIDAPGRWYNEKWEDDPYNRVPFPWDDTPGYYVQRTEVISRYAVLGQARMDYPALRTGSFDTLLTDDETMVYAYGRKLITGSRSDAAVVIVNRDDSAHTASLDVVGYLGEGVVFHDVLHGDQAYTVTGGMLEVADLPGIDGALLVLTSGDLTPPDPPANLVALEGEGQVLLSWDPVTDTVDYNLYRSLFSGGGYAQILTGTIDTTYTDTAVANGTWYYYVVTAVDAANNESGASNEAAALPHYDIDWANLQGPPEITHTIGLTPTPPIYGQMRIDGIANPIGQPIPSVRAQVGFGPVGTAPADWSWWVEATYNQDVGSNKEYVGTLTPESIGEYHYLYRYSTTAGRDWVYADQSGIISASGVVSPGLLHVLSSGDLTPPAAPQNLQVIHWGVDHITLEWDAVGGPDLYAYDLFRWGEGETISDALHVDRIVAPTTVYTDQTVLSNHTYTYTVQALDTSYNRSGYSNYASGVAVQRDVTITFQVEVPAFTPAKDPLYIAGNNADVFGASFDPSAMPMTQIDSTHWQIVLQGPEDITLEYKYTRGNWDRVERWGWLVGYANREITVTYGETGAMTVTDIVHNWRDPLVVSVYPLSGSTSFSTSVVIAATFNRALNPATVDETSVRVNGGAVTGTVGYISPTVYFTPGMPLAPQGAYQVELTTAIREAIDGVPLQQAYHWAFGEPQESYAIFLPLVTKAHNGK